MTGFRHNNLSDLWRVSEEGDGAAQDFPATDFDLRRLARTVWLEKISGVSLSHFENSQNLNMSPDRRYFRHCATAQLRNYPRLAESWKILHAAEVFDSVSRNEAAIIEESLQEKSGSAAGAQEPAQQET